MDSMPRFATSLSILALASACAQDSAALKAEIADLRAQVKAMREQDARLEKRLERLEVDEVVRSARSRPADRPAGSSPPADLAQVPSLTVVKLKPKGEAPPPISTAVPVIEPPPEVVEALASRAPRAGGQDGEGEDPGDQAEEDPDLAVKDFETGLDALRTGNVAGGVEKLRQFTRDHPRHSKADNALYFAGIGLIGLSEWEAAAQTFEGVVREYPAGDAVVDAMLKLAECRVRQSRKDEARRLYGEVIARYPGTSAATSAEQKLAQLVRTP
jgi:tol-pal system protein YbgF